MHPHAKKTMPNATSHFAIVFLVELIDLLVIHLVEYAVSGEKHNNKVYDRQKEGNECPAKTLYGYL